MIKIEQVCRDFGTKIIDKKGFHPTPFGSLALNGDLSLSTLNLSADEIANKAFSLCRDLAVSEFFVSVDCYNRPVRAHPSILIIFYVCKGKPARLAVMEYGWDAKQNVPIIEDVRWNDAFWSKRYFILLSRLTTESGKPAAWCSGLVSGGGKALLN